MIDAYYSLFVPNSFTPDGDGVNDGWRPIWEALDPATYRLSVFDRWGTEIWASNDAYGFWDGKVNGHDPVHGVYAWKLRVRDMVDKHGHDLTGHVTILR